MENHMKDFLQDLVAHTHSLGFLPLVRVSSTTKETKIESIAEDRSVIVDAKTHNPIDQLEGVFGMPDLNKLDLHLKCPEYKEGAGISVVKQDRNGETIPTGLHFQNALGDFENDYRFMNEQIINEKLKSAKFKGTTWDVVFEPAVASIQKLKYQAAAHTEEKTFQVKTENGNLVFYFGDANTHAGSFIFQSGVTGKLKQMWAWPVNAVQAILALSGDKTMRIADAGALQITVDSGIAVYNYILPAQSK
jgi:hypothetical protein